MRFCILASALCLLTSSVGASLLDTTHNVGVREILAPRGTVDSGSMVVPKVIVRNYGTATETLSVFVLMEGGHRDSLSIAGLPGRSSDTVEFPPVAIHSNESLDVWSWTRCPRDSFAHDDTAWTRFLVRVLDVAVTEILAPVDTLDSGLAVGPRAMVWNYGNQTQTFPLEFRIGSWVSRATVVNLIPGGQQEIVAPDPYYTVPGIYLHRVTAILPGDLHPENNVLRDTFWVRGTIRRCVLVTWITDYDSVALGSSVPVRCSVANLGTTEQFWILARVWDTAGTTYSESTQTMLGAGGRLRLSFHPAPTRVCGMHVVRCSLAAAPPCSTNFLDDTFYVVPLVPYLVGLESLFGPPDTVGPDDSLCFGSYLHNRTYDHVIAAYYWTAYNPGGSAIFFVDTILVVPPRSRILTTWRMPYVGGDTGRFMVRESLGTPQLDVKTQVVVWRFHIRGPGVEEAMNDERAAMGPPATVCRGVLFLPQSPVANRQAPSALLDAAGRKVLALKPGRNDVRHLPAGVYFVRLEPSAVSRQPSAVAKVVIQR